MLLKRGKNGSPNKKTILKTWGVGVGARARNCKSRRSRRSGLLSVIGTVNGDNAS